MRSLSFVVFLALAASGAGESWEIVQTATLPAKEANQAAATDERFVFAIASAVVGKYDRTTGERLAVSTGAAHHLNSGFLWEGRLYCAHSNYPRKPERSEIMVLDPAVMAITSFKDFGESHGSLTWAVREGGHWWCNFAFYGADKAKTVLVKFDDAWGELGKWTYPESVLADLGNYSISGGIWYQDRLLVTGHDHRVIYRLRLPESGSVLTYLDTVRSPFPGQGIAFDLKTGGLLGIDRGKRAVVFGEWHKR